MTEKQTIAATKAAELWATFSENEKAGVRFGMFPAGPMQGAEQAGVDGHALTVALMDCAAREPRAPSVARARGRRR
jgi:hypothetical protein